MLRTRILLGAVVAATAACGEPATPTGPTQPALSLTATASVLRIAPDSAALPLGGTLKLTGWVTPPGGVPYDNTSGILWYTLDPAIARLAPGGTVRSYAPGRARIVGTYNGGVDTAVIIVPGPTTSIVSRVDLAPSGAVAVGASALFPVSVYDGAGQLVPAPVVTWSSSDPAVLSVDAGGVATGRAHGYAMLIASSGGKSDTMGVTVGTPAQPGDVALTLRRFATGSGTIRATGGIPLRAGQLRAGDLSLVRVFVAGREVPIYAEALSALHPDGSLRSVYVELDADLSTTPVEAVLRIGTRRLAGDLTRGDPANRGQPAAAVLPASADYLVSTGIVGRTLTAAQTTALGGAFATWEARFAPAAERHWSIEGARWEGNYYDRAHLYYAAWARTANPEYFRRAAAVAVTYRRDFLEANNYQSSPHWAQPEGLQLHYLLTGDAASRRAVAELAQAMATGYLPYVGLNVHGWMESRIQARVLHTMLMAWRINAASSRTSNWAPLLDSALTQVLRTQGRDGAYRFSGYCDASINFMAGLLNDALIRYHTYYRPDLRILLAVRSSADFLWNSQWLADRQVFRYMDRDCPGEGGTIPGDDLDGLMVTAYGWLYRQTGDATYRTRGDLVFAGINTSWLEGSKQFNQSYSSSYGYLGHR